MQIRFSEFWLAKSGQGTHYDDFQPRTRCAAQGYIESCALQVPFCWYFSLNTTARIIFLNIEVLILVWICMYKHMCMCSYNSYVWLRHMILGVLESLFFCNKLPEPSMAIHRERLKDVSPHSQFAPLKTRHVVYIRNQNREEGWQNKLVTWLEEMEFELEYSKVFGYTSSLEPRKQDGAARPCRREPRTSEP